MFQIHFDSSSTFLSNLQKKNVNPSATGQLDASHLVAPFVTLCLTDTEEEQLKNCDVALEEKEEKKIGL